MEINVKTTTQKSFKIQAELEDSIQIIKEKIQKFNENDSRFAPDVARLIYKGKILKNDQIVKDLNIKSADFFVVMPGKGPNLNAKQTSSTGNSTTKSSENQQSSSKKEEKESTAVEKDEKTENKTETTASSTSNNDSTVAAPTAVQPETPQTQTFSDDLIRDLMAISGETAERVKLSLTATNGNSEVAANILLSGQLDTVLSQINQQQARTATNTGSGTGSGTGANTGAGSGNVPRVNNLRYLTQNEQFRQMMNVIRSRPEALSQILQQIGQANPDLLRQIQDNHEDFLALLNDEQSDTPNVPSNADAPIPQGQRIEVNVTPEEQETIQRLMALGFSQIEAVQAFIACDRNEQMAANFLLEQ